MQARLLTFTEYAALLVFTGVLAGYGIYQGLKLYVLQLDLFWLAVEIVLLDAAFTAVSFSVILIVSTILFGASIARSRTEKRRTGPECAIIIPAYQEVETLPRAVASVLDSTYENLSVVIACQKADPETHDVARRLAEDEDRVRFVVNRDGPQSKPGNVNHAVTQSDAPFIAVFDADSTVHPGFIGAAVDRLEAGEADVVQARLIPEPSGLVESLAYYQNVIFTSITQQLIKLFHGFRLALSNGTVMTRDAYETVDGYDNVMVDDYDFAFKCYRHGLDVTPFHAYPVWREPAHTLQDWWGQRQRWMISYAQVFHKLLHDSPSFRSHRDVVSLIIAGATVIGPLFILVFVAKLLLLVFLGAELLYAIPILMIIGAAVVIQWYDHRYNQVARIHPVVMLVPIVLPVLGLISIHSILAYLLSWDGSWYQTARRL